MTDSDPEKHSKLIRGQKHIGKNYHRLEFLTLQFNCTYILRANFVSLEVFISVFFGKFCPPKSMVHIIFPFYLKFAKMKPPVQSQGQKIGWRCFDSRRKLRPNKTQHFLARKIWQKFRILVDFLVECFMARFDIFYLRKKSPKKFRRYFSARFSRSLPALERLAQHTIGEMITRPVTRATSRGIGQDRFDQTEMFCCQKKQKNIRTRI